jgi:hypothetical protein
MKNRIKAYKEKAEKEKWIVVVMMMIIATTTT